MKQYAMYKGEECLGIGTLIQLAKQLNVTYKTLRFYTTPTYKKRCEKGKDNGKNRRTLIEV